MSGYVIIFYFIFTHFLEIFTLQRKILDGDLVLVPTESKKNPQNHGPIAISLRIRQVQIKLVIFTGKS